jgi:hypothetical protein
MITTLEYMYVFSDPIKYKLEEEVPWLFLSFLKG